jgi:hypothetical protein
LIVLFAQAFPIGHHRSMRLLPWACDSNSCGKTLKCDARFGFEIQLPCAENSDGALTIAPVSRRVAELGEHVKFLLLQERVRHHVFRARHARLICKSNSGKNPITNPEKTPQ